MLKTLTILSLLLVSFTASARERISPLCEKAPRLAEVHQQLPEFILSSKADTPAKLINNPRELAIFFAPNGIMTRTRSTLVCVLLAVDSSGQVKDAIVSHPARLALSGPEREKLLTMRYEPAQHSGQPRASLVNVVVEY